MPMAVPVTLSDGQPALLLTFSYLTVQIGATFSIRGDKPVIVAARGDVTILGTLDASSSRATPGPGGGYSMCGGGTGNVGVWGSADRGSGADRGDGAASAGLRRRSEPGATRSTTCGTSSAWSTGRSPS